MLLRARLHDEEVHTVLTTDAGARFKHLAINKNARIIGHAAVAGAALLFQYKAHGINVVVPPPNSEFLAVAPVGKGAEAVEADGPYCDIAICTHSASDLYLYQRGRRAGLDDNYRVGVELAADKKVFVISIVYYRDVYLAHIRGFRESAVGLTVGRFTAADY